MFDAIWNFMRPETLSISAGWLMEHIFLEWTNGLVAWFHSANYTYSAIIIFIVVAICLLELWTLGLAAVYCGPWAWVLCAWLTCWLFYLFAIPALSAMYFAKQMTMPGRLHKFLVFLLLLVFLVALGLFPIGLTIWYGVIFFIYLFVFLDLQIPNRKPILV